MSPFRSLPHPSEATRRLQEDTLIQLGELPDPGEVILVEK